MAIEHEVDGLYVNCDGCSEYEFVEHKNYALATAHVRKQGWSVTNDDGRWTHLCPSCTAEAAGLPL